MKSCGWRRHSWEIQSIRRRAYVNGMQTELYRKCRTCKRVGKKEISGEWTAEELRGSQHDR